MRVVIQESEIEEIIKGSGNLGCEEDACEEDGELYDD